jgi:hypothetical protein
VSTLRDFDGRFFALAPEAARVARRRIVRSAYTIGCNKPMWLYTVCPPKMTFRPSSSVLSLRPYLIARQLEQTPGYAYFHIRRENKLRLLQHAVKSTK